MSTPDPIQTPHCLMFKYRYERLLGEGTNGKTYLATDLRTGQKLAIKELKLNQSENFKSFELFKREAETLSSLDLDGVPKFYESILSEEIGGECYIVQEFIHAPSIQSYLNDKRKFTEEETLAIMQKTALILHVLHTQYSPPVIHRDIKPSNILCDLSSVGSWNNIKPYLIDFGAVANAHSNTDKSTIAGTIGYMAPEQNFGECLPQTDLYALGATALHMLTGVPPYEMEFDTYALKFEKAIDENAPKTSPEMRALLAGLLQVSYDKRPESASALIDEIAKIRGEEVPAEEEEQNTSAFARFLNKVFFWTKKNALNPAEITYGYLSKLLFPLTDTKPLKTAQGIAHAYMSLQRDKYIEYTFEAEGSTWAGCAKFSVPITEPQKLTISQDPPKTLDPTLPPPPELVPALCLAIDKKNLDALTKKNRNKKNVDYRTESEHRLNFPVKCIVLYHADDPSCNRLLYVIKDNPQSEPETKEIRKHREIVHLQEEIGAPTKGTPTKRKPRPI